MAVARLHSIETFGAVDGSGIRTVFFLQGCPARCAYCHNPDIWNPCGGSEITVEEVVRRAKRGKSFYGREGGEPLLQGEFLLEAIEALHAEGIRVATDASGTYFDEYTAAVISACDMILLDIKHINPAKFKELTGRDQSPLFRLIEEINRTETPI